MHKDWEELIPYYVAGSLTRPDTSRLEGHLARCEDCRRSVDEWRAVASVVRADAAAQLRDLPPLSRRVMLTAARDAANRRAQALSPSYAPLQRIAPRPRPAYRITSVTLIAAVFTVIIFGGLLALMVLRGSLFLPQPAAESVVLLPSATPFPQGASATPSPAPQIIVIEPSATPVSPEPTLPETPFVLQTTAAPLIFVTPVPPTATRPPIVATRVPPTSVPPPTATPETAVEAFSLQAPTFKDACTLHSAVTLSLAAGPGNQYGVIGTASAADGLPALASSDNGWFQTQLADGTVGWVRADQVYTSGNCDSLTVITSAQPTQPPTATVYSGVPVVVVTADSVNLRSGPGTIYPIVSLAFAGDRIPVTAMARASGDNWYLVDQAGQGAVWVSASVVQLQPADAFVPPAATIPPTPAPSETVIPFMATSTPSETSIPTIQKPAQ